MDRLVSFFRHIYFAFILIIRNIRWVAILLFCGDEKAWNVLDFKMFLSAKKAGLDPKESSIHKQLILDGVRERKSTEIMTRFIKPDDVILELGANIGYYVMIESRILSDKGYIYAVEPGLENVERLKKNIALNSVTNIEVCNLAMSDNKGMAKLYLGKACNLHSLISSSVSEDEDYAEVETDTVDGFLSDRRPISFLRMDIEGYETEVIGGMHHVLGSPQLERLFVEVHPHKVSQDKMENLLKTLTDYGFEIKYAVSRDKFQRAILGQSKVEEITAARLINDPRFTRQKISFELFFQKKTFVKCLNQ